MRTLRERLEEFTLDDAGCWIWQRCIDANGYGRINVIENGRSQTRLAHRIMYEFVVGPVPRELHVDHLCRVRACVRPGHLEAVTVQENNRRMVEAVYKNATHCKRGHSWADNERWHRKGYRYCATCHRERELRRRRALPPTTCEECGGEAPAQRRFCSVSCSSRWAWAHTRRKSA